MCSHVLQNVLTLDGCKLRFSLFRVILEDMPVLEVDQMICCFCRGDVFDLLPALFALCSTVLIAQGNVVLLL